MVDGQPSGSLDISTRWYLADSEEEVRQQVAEEGGHSYQNSDGQQVAWQLRHIMAVEPFPAANSGDEVIGFIADLRELEELAGP